MDSQVTGYDVTIPGDKWANANELGAELKKWAKNFAFQLEQGSETGYVHWQVRLRLIKKKRLSEVLNDVAPIIGGHWTVTSKNTHAKNSFNYVMKADTRIDGPWTDKDMVDPPKLTRQLKTFLESEKYPWQQTICELVVVPDDRKIHFIWDEKGNSGKSIFAEYLEYRGLACELPPLRAFEDLMQFAAGLADQKAYLIDMPRALKKDKLSEFYSGIECLKNGILWDKRYHAQKRRQDRPNVFVFANELPAFEFLSPDRWVVLEMRPDKSFRVWDEEKMKRHMTPCRDLI